MKLDSLMANYTENSDSPNCAKRESGNSKRRKAVLPIRYISAPLDHIPSLKEALAPKFSCIVEPSSENNFTVPEAINCSSNKIVYHEKVSPNQCRVNGLYFLLMGQAIERDFSAYSCCVRIIEFHGHLTYIKPAFHIIQQLKSLEKIYIFIGDTQLPFFNETISDVNSVATATPPNPNAKFLSVKVDILIYKAKSICSGNKTIDDILESILIRAKYCLPNLDVLYMEAPCSGKLAKLTEELIDGTNLRQKFMTSFCPFAEALFVVPFRKADSACLSSNDLDLELLDILNGRPFNCLNVRRNANPVEMNLENGNAENRLGIGSAVYYRQNHPRYVFGDDVMPPRPPAPIGIRPLRNIPREDIERQDRILQRLRQQNILGNNNRLGQPNFLDIAQQPRVERLEIRPNVFVRRYMPPPFRHNEEEHNDWDDVV